MTTVTGDLRNVLGEKAQGTVRWRSTEVRPAVSYNGEVIDDWHSAPVVDGVFSVEVEPGGAVVRVVAGTTNWSAEVVVPDEGEVTLAELIESHYEYTPPMVTKARMYASEARGYAERAEAAKGILESAVPSVREDRERAEAAVSSAEGSAGEALGYASEAERFAGEASVSASSAGGSASSAGGFADAAGRSAAEAAQSAAGAVVARDAAVDASGVAVGAGDSASQSALAAAGSASEAAGHADRAAEASGSVEAVVRDAASVLEEELRGTASDAKGYAEEAAVSASQAASAAREEVERLKGDAPEAFDTLGEIAAELAKNESDRSALANSIAAKADKGHSHTMADVADLPPVSETVTDPGLVTRAQGGFLHGPDLSTGSASSALANKGYVDSRVSSAEGVSRSRPAVFSGASTPPSTISGAVVGDLWLDTRTLDLYRITSV